MAGIAPSVSTGIMAGSAASTTAAGLAGTAGLAQPAEAGQATNGYSEVSTATAHPLAMRPTHRARQFADTVATYAPVVGIGTALAAALVLRDWSGLSLLSMAVPTLIFPVSTGATGATPEKEATTAGLPPPLPEFDAKGASTAASQDTPQDGGAVVQRGEVFHDDAHTRRLSDDALAATAAVDRPKPTRDGKTKPVAKDAAAASAAVHDDAVLTPRGQMSTSGTDHAAFTLDVTDAAKAAAKPGGTSKGLAATALTPTPAQLFKAGGGIVSYSTIEMADGPHILARVETGKTSGKYRFAIAHYRDSDTQHGGDWINLKDKTVDMNHAWVDVDLDHRRVIVSAKNGRTLAPHHAGEDPTLVRNETQRVVIMGYASSVRLQFGNSFVDVQIPSPASKTVIADFRGRAEAALERASSLLALAITPRFEVTSDTFTIHIKSGENRSLTLQMPSTIDPAASIDLMAAVLSRTNFLPTVAGHSTPLHLHIIWSEPAQFLARLDERHLEPLPHHLANVGGLLETGPNNSVRIELPSRFTLSDRLDETGGTIFRSRIALASDVLSRVALEVRQLTVALDYAWAALGRDNSLITPSRQP